MKKETKTHKFALNDISRREFVCSDYIITAPADLSIEDATKPEAFTQIAGDLKPWDNIEIRWEDMSKKVVGTVRDCNKFSAIIGIDAIIEYKDKDAKVDAAESPFEVKWGGPYSKFGVYRKADGQRVAENYTTREMAESEMQNQLRAL